MKALTYTLTLLLSVTLMSSCSNNQFAQQEYDDMYYTAQDRQKAIEEEQARIAANRQAKLEQQRQREAAAAERTKNAYDQQDAQSARELNPDAVATYSDGGSDEYYEEEYYDEQRGSSYTTPAGSTNVYNNYYYNNRGAYDPWRYDPYWNSFASPWGWGRPGWGSGFSVNIGFNSWNNWCDPFDPWCGSAYYYDAYRPAWAWNGWGYRNSYARGYQDGFYNGFYGRRNYWGSYYNPTAVIVYNNASNQESGRRNVSYGPRSTRAMAAADLGTGRRAANDPVLRDNQRQRVQEMGGTRGSMNGRTINGEGQRVRPATNNSRERVNPTERGVRPSDRTNPTSRPRSPRTEPGRSNDNARPQRQPTERTRPMPQNRPSPAPRDNGGSAAPSRRDNSGGSAPSRSRGGRGGAPLESNMDGNLERDRNAQRSSADQTSPVPAQRAIQPRERAIPAERSRYSQDQQMERRAERREAPAERYSSPQQQERTRTRPADNSGYSRPAPDRSYSAPAQRNSDNNRSYSTPSPAPRERSMPERSFSNPSPSSAPSRPAPSYDNGGSRSSERSSPSRSSGSSSGGSRTRGGN